MIDILDEIKQDFLVYAQEVNTNRSFPDARDGLKPGMRAALWEMYSKGYSSAKPHVKSAKVSGGTIATWWPHGDTSVYEAIVRMSQDWVSHIVEVDFHGGNGSLLGGPDAASSRYTECRLSKASEDGFFSAIKKDTVDMIDNFSEDEKWPSVFPAIFPRLFVNGSQGIGYTIAQEWEPGNLCEFFEKVKDYLKSGKISCDGIYPDYPTGGVIINKSDIKTIYETGKGAIILRGKANISGKCINITELPYQVYAEPFIQKIKDLVNAGTLSGIDDICNKSDDNGLLVEIECSDSPEVVLNRLYKLTDLQVTFNANQMALVDGKPEMLSLQNYIKVYTDHNIGCLKREYKYDLDKAVARKEVVDGLIKAIAIIDDVIKTIKASKSSESAKKDLITTFNFTEPQAKAIVDMRLGKLANLETNELNAELSELVKTIEKCTKFLASDSLQEKEFIKRLEDFVNKYGWQRRTEVCDVDIVEEKKALKVEKQEERFNIILTKDNELKKVTLGKIRDMSNVQSVVEVGEKDRFVLISNSGQMYKLNAKDIKLVSQGSKGQNIKSEFFNDTIISIYTGLETEEYLFMITKNGLAKKIKSETVFGLSKISGAPVMKVNTDDEIISCRLASEDSVFKYKVGEKEKELRVCDFLDKGRTAGGVSAIKTKKVFILL